MTEYRQNRIIWLDIMKGIGIILVVLGHVYNNGIVFRWLYSFHMPLFFFAAGFLYKKKPILADIKRRIQTIVVPYFCFGFLIFIYWVLIEHRFREVNYDPVKAFLGLFLGEYNTLDFNVHLWFLPCFFLTVVVYNVLINLTGKKITYLIIIVLSLIYALEPVLSFEIPNLPWGADRMCRFRVGADYGAATGLDL